MVFTVGVWMVRGRRRRPKVTIVLSLMEFKTMRLKFGLKDMEKALGEAFFYNFLCSEKALSF